jgi:hypothetical protein
MYTLTDAEKAVVRRWAVSLLQGSKIYCYGVIPESCKEFITDIAIAEGFAPVFGVPLMGYVQVTFIRISPPC